jgi:hypothetical protein
LHDPSDRGRDQDPKNSAGERKHDAFRHQLPNQASPVGADGEPDGDFLAALGGAGQKKICQVHAGQKQNHNPDRAQDGGKREDPVANIRDKQAGRNQLDAAARIFLWVFLPHLEGQGAQ